LMNHIVRELIPQLKAAGAEGITEYPLNQSSLLTVTKPSNQLIWDH